MPGNAVEHLIHHRPGTRMQQGGRARRRHVRRQVGRRLHQNRAGIDGRCQAMQGDAEGAIAVGQRVDGRHRPAMARQERRVDVDAAQSRQADRGRRQDLIEVEGDDEVGRGGSKRIGDDLAVDVLDHHRRDREPFAEASHRRGLWGIARAAHRLQQRSRRTQDVGQAEVDGKVGEEAWAGPRHVPAQLPGQATDQPPLRI